MGMKKKTKKSRRSRKQIRSKGMIDALFSSTLQRVLGLLYAQPERRFFATELIGLIGAGSGAVQRELLKLTAAGLVTQEVVTKQKFYRANREAPIFNELRGIILKTVGLAEPVREALLRLSEHIDFALIFGSVAKRQDTASSDLDLLIVSDELSLQKLFEALSPVERKLGRAISPTLYKRDEFSERVRTKNPFVRKILEGDFIQLLGKERFLDEVRSTGES
jgi:predicted nucleotidyltransferase